MGRNGASLHICIKGTSKNLKIFETIIPFILNKNHLYLEEFLKAVLGLKPRFFGTFGFYSPYSSYCGRTAPAECDKTSHVVG